ncbi:Uncharacterised protein [Mycobacteroides abscessus subsp. abscessus]|nr:Uncharacterised protein [Mycobacteroides abscessus subsp. abscessus]
MWALTITAAHEVGHVVTNFYYAEDDLTLAEYEDIADCMAAVYIGARFPGLDPAVEREAFSALEAIRDPSDTGRDAYLAGVRMGSVTPKAAFKGCRAATAA